MTLQFVVLFFNIEKYTAAAVKGSVKFRTTLITQIDNLYENDPEVIGNL